VGVKIASRIALAGSKCIPYSRVGVPDRQRFSASAIRHCGRDTLLQARLSLLMHPTALAGLPISRVARNTLGMFLSMSAGKLDRLDL
jgi:hypothetical protein